MAGRGCLLHDARGSRIFVSRALDEGDTTGMDSEAFRGLVRNVFLQRHARYYLLTANLWVDGRLLFNGRDCCLLEYVVCASEEDKKAGHPVSQGRTTTDWGFSSLGTTTNPPLQDYTVRHVFRQVPRVDVRADHPYSFRVPVLTRPGDQDHPPDVARTQLPPAPRRSRHHAAQVAGHEPGVL